MSGYRKPKQHLHREFVYLNHDTILNSLSAIEAGEVDEIIQKANEAREGGLDGAISVGPAKASGGRKRSSTIQEELVRTRTWFSAFDAWHRYLDDANAIGTFDTWDTEVRDELQIGDTIRFQANIAIAPLHKLFHTYIAFASNLNKPNSVFQVKGSELQDTKKITAMMTEWMGGKDRTIHLAVYFRPGRVTEPKILGRLEDRYIVGSREAIEGDFTVIGQVEQILEKDEVISTIRVIRDVPPTPKEIQVATEAMLHMISPAKELGVEIEASDISVPAPAILLRPVAIFQ
ncbi:MAG TPA: hypothetical protein VHX38_17280 [Pseudonocardiaceae bacterium]|nr:hypothetical protein [Pseudonocardiaceae bacterium]